MVQSIEYCAYHNVLNSILIKVYPLRVQYKSEYLQIEYFEHWKACETCNIFNIHALTYINCSKKFQKEASAGLGLGEVIRMALA